MDRMIMHVDVNSAFLSWEASKRIKLGQSDLRLVPSAIGGDRDKRTGVILAKSIPAKAFGVKTGEPVASALRKCPNLILSKPDFPLYEACSKRFMDICRSYAPSVEKFSIDECFLDMTGTAHMYPDPVATAYEIKNKIRDELGFTVNVGIGPNKLLAKMASDFEKPDRVHTLFSWELAAKFWPLPVRDLFSVGSATAEKLERAYIKTIGDLAKQQLETVQNLVGKKAGWLLYRYANGLDDSPVLSQPEECKGYGNSITMEEDVTSAENAHQILLALVDSTATRLRADNAKTQCIAVTIRGNDFKDHSHQIHLDAATDVTNEIYRIAKQLFTELWDQHMPLRLLGVALTAITRSECEQLSLFQDRSSDRDRKIDQTVDAIRKKFGSDTITRASSLYTSLQVGRKQKKTQEE